MSFLELINLKKKKLKPSETVVTHLNGQKYRKSGLNIEKLDEASTGYVIDTKPDKIPAKIVDNLYFGTQDCCEMTVLIEYNIKNVLSVGIEAPIQYPNVTYKFVECLDLPETKLEIALMESLPYIENCIDKSENILVHCNAGVSRSASIVIGYLILKLKKTFVEAFDLVKDARNCARPNDGFRKQLQNLKDDSVLSTSTNTQPNPGGCRRIFRK